MGPHLLDLLNEFKDEDIAIFNALFLKGYEEESVKKLLEYENIYIYDPYGVETGFCSNLVYNLNSYKYKGNIFTKAIPLEFIAKGKIEEQEVWTKVDLNSLIQDIKKIIHGS